MAITSFHPTDSIQALGIAVVQRACEDFILSVYKELDRGRGVPKVNVDKYNYRGRVKTIKQLPSNNNEWCDAIYVDSRVKTFYWTEDGKGGYWKEMPIYDDVAMFFLSDQFPVICPNINPQWLIKKLIEEAKSRYDKRQ